MKRNIIYVTIVLMLILAGCKHSLIGRSVHTEFNYFWCHYIKNPDNCFIRTEHLIFTFSIDKTTSTSADIDEYMIKGKAEPVNVKAFSSIHTGKSDFYFVLANHGIITDVVPFIFHSDNVQGAMPFEAKIRTKPFNAIGIIYEFYVTG